MVEAVWDRGHLAIPIAPLPGEGLAEMIVRATAENSYGCCATITNALGIRGKLPVGLATRFQAREKALASLLGIPGEGESLRSLLYLPMEARTGWQSFFGTSIRQIYREVAGRRVSPRALAISPHLRAIWSVRIFPFDPLTKEMLINRCPVCSKSFGWARTRGTVYCDQCLSIDDHGCERGIVDLRDFPQPLVDEKHWAKLDILTGLIDPDQSIRADFNPQLPEVFRVFDRGEIFEFAVALGSAFEGPSKSQSCYLSRAANKEQCLRFTPAALAKVATALLDWPATFNSAVEATRNDAWNDAGNLRWRTVFGSFAQLAIDRFIHPGLQKLVRGELERHLVGYHSEMPRMKGGVKRQDMNAVPICVASEILKTSRTRISRLVKRKRVSAITTGTSSKASVLVSVPRIAAIIAADAELVSVESAASRLGLPGLAILSLVEDGLLRKGVNHEGQHVAKTVARCSIDELIRTLDERLCHSAPPPRVLSLFSAAILLGSPRSNPWPDLLQLVIRKKVTAWKRRLQGPVSSCIAVNLNEIEDRISLKRPWACKGDATISHRDAIRLLGTNGMVLYALFDAGILPRKLLLSHLQAFSSSNVLTGELLDQLTARDISTVPYALIQHLQKRGLHATSVKRGLVRRWIWPRAKAEAAIGHILVA
ncbi:MAG: hypothetical protein ACTHNH_05250 [Mesorhizobium sp.]